MIVSLLQNHSGFYSTFFFTVNHYMFAKKNNLNFLLNGDNWLFRYKDGWTDYFETMDITQNQTTESNMISHPHILQTYPLYEYVSYMKEIYVYNENTKKRIEEAKNKLNIVDGKYDSIFIRRGDKLCHESPYFPTEKYIDELLIRDPQCKTIFLQTDDYNSFIDLDNYIKERNLDIRIITLCDKNTKGMVVLECIVIDSITENYREKQDTFFNNKELMNTVVNDLKNSVHVSKLSKDELFEHTIQLIVGIEIVLQSNICVCDYFSNISRFIKLMHTIPDNVFDIYRPDNMIDYNTTIIPAFEESFYGEK